MSIFYPTNQLICKASADGLIPINAEIISINGTSTEQIINSMLPYVSGEKEFYRLSNIARNFQLLYQMLYPSDKYEIEYRDMAQNIKNQRAQLPSITNPDYPVPSADALNAVYGLIGRQ